MKGIILFFIFVFVLATNNGFSKDKRYLEQYKHFEDLDDSLQCVLLYDLAHYYSRSNFDSSLFFSDKLFTIAQKNSSNYFLYCAYKVKGSVYYVKGEFELALEALLKAEKYAQKANYTRGIAIVYSTLGDTYKTANNHSLSIFNYTKSIKILREINDSTTLANILFNQAGEYKKRNKLDSALKYFHESKHIYEVLNNKSGIAYNMGALADIFKKQGEIKFAKKSLIQAIEMLTVLEDDYFLTFYKLKLAKIYYQESDYDSTLTLTYSSLALANKLGLPGPKRDASNWLSKIYRAQKDYKQAYYYKSQYIALADSIFNNEVIRDMAEIRTKYEVSKKQVEIKKANTELKISQEKRARQQIIGIGLIVGILLIGSIASVLVRNSRREKEINAILLEQKEELESQRDLLSEVNNTKDRFFSIISHDLRGPIGVLGGTTMLIREYLESRDFEQLDELTSNMEYTVNNVQALLDNLLEWAVSQRGHYNYTPENVDLNKLILDTVTIFQEMAAAKNISLNFKQSLGEEYLTVDKNSVSTILRNLISNAIKFTRNGGTVSVLINRSEQDVQISVKDSGVGIPQEKINKLFEIEPQKSTWGTGNEKGLGVGLNLVSEFVKLNNAAIQVNSTVNVGTTFTLVFPLVAEAVQNEEIQAKA